MEKWLIILTVAGLMGFCPYAHGQGDEYRARIAVELQGRQVTIRPFCYAPEYGVVQYRFSVIKSGPSGKSTSYQSGTARLQKGEEKCLSQSGIGITPEDKYEIIFEVLKDNKLVASQRICYPSDC